MQKLYSTQDANARRMHTRLSYYAALDQHRMQHGLARISWATWGIVVLTTLIWCFTACKTALAAGAHGFPAILANIINNAVKIQPNDNGALSSVLITYGAKENDLILHGQYWRFITPIFLHVNALHIGLNMLNLAVMGVFVERLTGHLRLLLIYFVTGVVSIIASFYFAPQDVSVGASGAIFGLVGAYSVFILMHRRAFRGGGIFAVPWLVIVIGLNLSIGLFVQNVDNYAHLGGLVSGCLLGWWFTPLYRLSNTHAFIDVHSLARRWPLALLTLLGTVALAMLALYLRQI